MTGGFRKAAYAVLDDAKELDRDDKVEVVEGTVRWVMPLGELKQMLWQDRQRQKRERKAAHAR